jgi:hypothetical protein
MWITGLLLFKKTKTFQPFKHNESFDSDYANIEGTKGLHVSFCIQCRELYLENLFKVLKLFNEQIKGRF